MFKNHSIQPATRSAQRVTWIFPLLFLLSACQMAPIIGSDIEGTPLKDGVYEGSFSNGPNGAKVEVTIVDGRIEAVKVLRHFSSWKGWAVDETIPRRIVDSQSTRVDVVSGATNSSIVVMNAAQKALEKAYE
ncbi:MAG: FMN-binding protein [Desulfobacteraceae bacterium]|jgi:uncharacterized protein with FMN-binding domain|nr:FMN-binding protein [Desulfobacteraceae bacterium]